MKRQVAVAGKSLVRNRIAPNPKAPHPIEVGSLVSGVGSEAVDDRYQPGHMMRVCGERLNYNPYKLDEGVFLIDENGAEQRINSGARIAPQGILFVMPTETAGNYWLQIRRRHPSPDGKLLVGRYEKLLKPV